MKNTFYLFILLIFFSCNNLKENDKSVNTSDTLVYVDSINDKCNCTKYSFENRSSSSYIVLPNTRPFSKISIKDSIIIEDADNNIYKLDDSKLDNSIKEIIISEIKKIPEELRRFENIERIRIDLADSIDLTNLSLFPKLKEIRFFFIYHLYINPQDEWLSNIESLIIDKCHVDGLCHLSNFQNLKYLRLHYSFLKSKVMDFNNLRCIQSIIINGCGPDTIDLKMIDINRLNCLSTLVVDDVYGNVKGIPENLDVRKLEKLKIKSINLTEQEKKVLKINSR